MRTPYPSDASNRSLPRSPWPAGAGAAAATPPPRSSFTVASPPSPCLCPQQPMCLQPPAISTLPPIPGTVTLTVTRNAGFTGAVTLSVTQSSLPTNVKANFANATDSTGLTTIVPASSTTATLSIHAGYPDPTDSTFTKQLYPAPVPQTAIPIKPLPPGSPAPTDRWPSS